MNVTTQTTSTESEARIQERLLAVANASSWIVMGVSALTLIAWGFHLDLRIHGRPELTLMNPLTALGLLLAGFALRCSIGSRLGVRPRSRLLARTLGFSVGAFGAIKLVEFIFGFELLPVASLTLAGFGPGAKDSIDVAPNTAWNFLCAGTALMLLDLQTSRGFRPAQALFLLAALVSVLALLGYAYRVLSLYRVGSAMPMALPSAIGFTVLSLGGLAARPRDGLMRVITSTSAGGKMARRLLPLAFLVPWVLGGLRLLEEEVGVYQTEFGVAIFATGSIVVFTIFIWWNATLLHEADLEKTRTARRLALQYRATRSLAESPSLTQASPEILRVLCETLGCQAGVLWCVDPTARKIKCLEIWTNGAPELDGFTQETRRTAFGPSEELPGRVWATGRPAWIMNMAADPEIRRAGLLAEAGIRSAWALPILAGTETVAVLEFFSHPTEPPDAQSKEMLDAVCSQIGQRIERDRAEQQLRAATANLQRSNTELQQFASLASHDLSEPLRMVVSYLQLLSAAEKGKLSAQSTEFIGIAIDGARRMQSLINDLLAYSRLETSGRSFQTTDLEQVLRSATTNLKVAIEESGAVIHHEPLPTVFGDAIQLTQLLQNLIGNAIKFRGRDSPRVDLSATQRDSEWLLRVRDNGIGIDPNQYERIFVIFQRLHTRQEYPGTGMGLAICKRIIERHGGKIWVEPNAGPGTTFAFTLPANHSASPMPASTAPGATPAPGA